MSSKHERASSESAPSPPERRSHASLARAFGELARKECSEEPVYDAICRAAAADPKTLELLWEAPLGQQKPNLLLASVHDLVLAGREHPLAEYFPSAGGERSVDDSFVRSFESFRDTFDAELRSRIASRSTQTNEIGRCAVLHPVLAHLARSNGNRPIALLDFGASAGLNLALDAYRYDYGAFALGAEPSPDTPTVSCLLRGARAPEVAQAPVIATRLGLDVAPVDVHDAESVRWLRACLWPHDLVRSRRFEQAVAIARSSTWSVHGSVDDVVSIEAWLAALPKDVLPVVFHSWVLFYFTQEERERFARAMESLVQAYGAVWLSAESETFRYGTLDAHLRRPDGDATSWTSCSRPSEHGAGVEYVELARSHAHGKWLEWLVS